MAKPTLGAASDGRAEGVGPAPATSKLSSRPTDLGLGFDLLSGAPIFNTLEAGVGTNV